MKNKVILFYFILIFCINLFSNDELDYKKVDKKFYGISNFSEDDETELFNTLYNSNGLYFLIQDLKKDSSRINELKPFIEKINNNTLLGNTIKDSILLYIIPSDNNALIKILKDCDSQNNKAIKDLLELRKNYKNYSGSSFNFSTVIRRKSLAYNISLFLPSTDWNELKYQSADKKNQNDNRHVYSAGEDNYAGGVFVLKKKMLKNDLDTIKNTFEAKNHAFLFKCPMVDKFNKKNDDFLYEVKPGEIYLISENKKIGNYTFDKIYEQITINSDKYNFQNFVERQRFYITKNILFVVGIHSIIGGNHILSNKENLIMQHGLLLDTVNFE